MDRRGPMLSLNSLKEIASDLAGYAPEYNWKTTTYAGIGILQNVADGIKFFCKEIIVPDKADRLLYTIGPVIFISSSILLLVMVPFSPRIAASSAPLGLLVVMAAFSIAPIGVLTTGWACNNKYTLIGGMRSAAQLMAYEIPLLLSMAGVFLVAGSYNPMDIVAQQQGMWNVVPQFLGFIVFIVCMLAEVERVPFDLPEAEAELVEGWTTEIGGLRLGLVFAAEYIRGFVGAMIATILFLGGWSGPFLPGEIWFLLKVYGILIFFIILRWTVPRIRTDQILLLGWKRLLPLSLINLALAILYVEVF
jgi:NADH-quinone oxidoreductase subunit H